MDQALHPPTEFLAAAEALGIAFEDGDLERLEHWLRLLRAGNERMNLTRIVDPGQMWERHVLDSLTLLPIIASLEATSILDVGSGGGAPGLPLAITLPGVRVGLLESTGKKAGFLRETAEALGLDNVRVLGGRAETLAAVDAPDRGAWDVVVARAVGRLPVLLELTVPFVRESGIVLAIKGARAGEEIADSKGALHALHAEVVDTVPTPTGTIVVVRKQRRTPRAYPRGPGDPARNPISH